MMAAWHLADLGYCSNVRFARRKRPFDRFSF